MNTDSTTPAGPVPPEVRARLAAVTYLILPPSLGHNRRAEIAHRNVSQAFGPGLTDSPDQPLDPDGLERLRVRVLRLALGAGYRPRLPRPSMAARSGEAGDRDRALGSLIPAARAAYALRRVEGVGRESTVGLLGAAGVADPETAVRVAERLNPDVPPISPAALPSAAALRRRRHRAAGAFATACIVLLGGGVLTVAGSGGDDEQPAGPTGVRTSASRPVAEAAPKTAKTPPEQPKATEAATASATRAAARAEARQVAAARAAAAQARAARAARAAEAEAAAERLAAAEAVKAAQAADEAVARRAALAAAREAERAAAQQAAAQQAAARQAAREAEANRKAAARAERLRDPSLPDGGDVAPAPPTAGSGVDPATP